MLFLCIVVGLLQFLTTSTQPAPAISNTTVVPSSTPTSTPSVVPPTGNCTIPNSDCTCASNLNDLFPLLVNNKAGAKCAGGVWTVNDTLNLGGVEFNFQSDTLLIHGAFSSSSAALLTISVDPMNNKPSFFVNVLGNAYMAGTINVNLLSAPVAATSSPILHCESETLNSYNLAASPTLPDAYKLCRTVLNQGITMSTNGTMSVTIDYTVVIQDKVGFNCVTGRGDRSWVVALMILAGIHAFLILLFCLVTCQADSLYSKVWD